MAFNATATPPADTSAEHDEQTTRLQELSRDLAEANAPLHVKGPGVGELLINVVSQLFHSVTH